MVRLNLDRALERLSLCAKTAKPLDRKAGLLEPTVRPLELRHRVVPTIERTVLQSVAPNGLVVERAGRRNLDNGVNNLGTNPTVRVPDRIELNDHEGIRPVITDTVNEAAVGYV
jgi:hypothetical protein